MRRWISTLTIIVVCMSAIFVNVVPSQAAVVSIVPTFSILSVVVDTSVTILSYNFPPAEGFDVLMGYMGTRGVDGYQVATLNTGAGGSFIATFNIPDILKGQYQIAIRLESNTGKAYHAYNWFYNNPSGSLPPYIPGPVIPCTGNGCLPTFSITNVIQDVSVSITTYNFPAGDSFDVLMNYMGTRGLNGYRVATVSSGAGGTLTFTFNIPDHLKGQKQIAIRLQSNTGSGYFAYNWFYNGLKTGGGGIPGYYGYPTFLISGVVRNTSVSIVTHNLPPGEKFDVLMGPMGTRGIGGILITTIDTGTGGSQNFTFDIPNQLNGLHQISIRLKSITGSGLYAYNWFFNTTTP